METRNTNNDSLFQGNDRNQEPVWSPILGYQMYFSENKDREKETEENPVQQNTGDWGDESEWEELQSKENAGNHSNEETENSKI
ncbi:hypothetical protein [Flavobacterium gelatinilyticum]|uniref:hypothetical protein n=1 Tax=Flavobacterium gelatinilyticum TaxID=3003260 RepID=UPI0024804060|nr:hypothetical protein [Flavobacterium gelatinilyticum]